MSYLGEMLNAMGTEWLSCPENQQMTLGELFGALRRDSMRFGNEWHEGGKLDCDLRKSCGDVSHCKKGGKG